MPSDFELHQHKRIAIRASFMHFIRFVSAQGTFSLLNETWTLDSDHWTGFGPHIGDERNGFGGFGPDKLSNPGNQSHDNGRQALPASPL